MVQKRATATSTWIALRLLATILAVMAPALADAQTRTVTASWDAKTDQYTSGYRLYLGTSPTAMTSTADAGNNTSRQLTLATGTTYYFVVRGYNARGVEGPASNQAQITLSATALTATFTATLQGMNTAVLNWQTTGATTVTINGIAVALGGSGQQVINTATTYTLVATGAGGSLTRVATVVPNSPPIDCVLSAWSLQSATPWGLCTGGQQSRTETWVRSVVTQPANGGAACGPLQGGESHRDASVHSGSDGAGDTGQHARRRPRLEGQAQLESGPDRAAHRATTSYPSACRRARATWRRRCRSET